MDFNEFLLLLQHMKLLAADKGGCGYLSKTHASAIFKTLLTRAPNTQPTSRTSSSSNSCPKV